MMAFYIDNAISWAQFRLRGGWKNLVMVSSGYLVIVTFFICLFYQLSLRKNSVLEVSSIMVLVIQILILLLFGEIAIAGSIRRDLASRQIESHRLMPLSPVRAIVGYLAGAGVQMMGLWVVNLAIGSVLYAMRGVSVQAWLVPNAILLAFAISMWAATALATYVSRASFGLIIGLGIGGSFSGGMIFVIAPGLLAFTTPMQAHTIFQSSLHPKIETATAIGVGAQMLVAILCIRAAARKYAVGGALGITVAPALAMMGIWAGLTWLGLSHFHEIRPLSIAYARVDWHTVVVGSIASCLLIAVLPMSAAAWTDVYSEIRRLDGGRAPRRPWLVGLCLMICLLFCYSPMTATLNEGIVYPDRIIFPAVGLDHSILSYGLHPNAAMIVTVSAIFLIQVYLLMRIIYPTFRRPNGTIIIVVALLWFLPLLIDVILYELRNVEPRMDTVAVLSPIGTIIQAIDNPAKSAWVGVMGQGVVGVLLAVQFFISKRRRVRKFRNAWNAENSGSLPYAAAPN